MDKSISLAHGDGGYFSHQLIQEIFINTFGHKEQAKLDAALLKLPSKDIAVSTDSFVVKPIFFPGGNIGKLAITGTINDIAVMGAKPMYITASFIIEEGFSISDLKKIVHSMAEEAKKAGVLIITGDTKVVERGNADGIYINTAGIGIRKYFMQPHMMREGDAVIISGTIGDHGVAILSARNDLGIENAVNSDCAALNDMIFKVLDATEHVHIIRDPTRGGLATALVEICEDFQANIAINEIDLPILDEVKGICDILGYEAFYLANEGRVIMIVDSIEEEKVLQKLHQHENGKNARIIGRVIDRGKGRLYLKTPLGTSRRLERLSGLLLPRIC